MKRRDFLRAAGTVPVLAGLVRDVEANRFCGPFTINGAHYCYAGIRSSLTHVSAGGIDERNRVRWCWAACAEMLFRYQGHGISQERIVTATWGSIDAVPLLPAALVDGLEGEWIDESGDSFRVDAERLVPGTLSAAEMLGGDVPPIVVTPTHPVVLTRLRYVAMRSEDGRIQTADVHDPWPGRTQRRLSQSEWREASLLVALRVAPAG